MSQPSFALEDAKSRATRCAQLAMSAKNEELRQNWPRMERFWLQKAQEIGIAAAEPLPLFKE